METNYTIHEIAQMCKNYATIILINETADPVFRKTEEYKNTLREYAKQIPKEIQEEIKRLESLAKQASED